MSVKNHSDLNSEITSDITNNGAQLITGFVLQGKLLDLADSAINMLGDTGILGKLGYSSLFTISANGDIPHKKYVDDAISASISSGIYKDTGVFTFAGLTFNSGTTVNIGAVAGQIVDNETTPTSPTVTSVTYAGATNVAVTTVGSGLASYVMLDNTGTITFQNTFPTNAQRKTKIYLGKLGHPTGTITSAAIGNEPDFVISPIAQLRSLYKAIGFVNNGVIASPNGANLNFNISAGTVVHYASNFVTDRTTPNEIAVSAGTPQSFLYRTQTGVGGGFVTAIDPANYDVAGTVTAIPGSTNQATNQYIYCVPGLGFIVQRGQIIYSTLALAIAAVGKESFVVYPNLINNSILIGVLSVQKGATDLSNTAQAQFFITDKFGQIGGSTSGVSTATLQTAYNNSLQPQIVTSTTLGAVQFKRGSAADTDAIFQGLNGAGTTTFSIDGNGAIPDNLFTLKDDSDGTKKLQFQLSGISTATTRTLTIPNVNGTLITTGDTGTVSNTMLAGSIDLATKVTGLLPGVNGGTGVNNSGKTITLGGNLTTSGAFSLTFSVPQSTTWTLPNTASETLAGLGTAQTFSAKQTFTASTTEIASLTLLDTTYKIALEVAASNQLKVGTGFTQTIINAGASTWNFSAGVMTVSSNYGLVISGSGGSSITSSNLASTFKYNAPAGAFVQTNSFIIGNSGAWTSTTASTSGLALTHSLNVASGTSTYNIVDINPTVTWTGTLLTGLRTRLASGTNIYNIYADGTAQNRIIGSTAFFGAESFGGGAGVMFIANAGTNPTSNPSGGGILYVDSGALKFRGSSGTVTTIAPA